MAVRRSWADAKTVWEEAVSGIAGSSGLTRGVRGGVTGQECARRRGSTRLEILEARSQTRVAHETDSSGAMYQYM